MAEPDGPTAAPSAEQRMLERQGRGEVTAWEQLVALLGALLVAAALGYLGWQTWTEEESPPVLRLEAGTPERRGAGYLVGFVVFNDGRSTAAALEVVGRLERGGEVVEESRATVEYLPPRSSRTGGLFFARDPAGHALVLQPGGYADP